MVIGAGDETRGPPGERVDARFEGLEGGVRERERGRVFKYSNRGGGDREGATRAGATLWGIGASGSVRMNCVSFVDSRWARKD